MLFKIIVDPNWNRRVSKRVKTNKNITTWSQNQNSFFISSIAIKLNWTHFFENIRLYMYTVYMYSTSLDTLVGESGSLFENFKSNYIEKFGPKWPLPDPKT